MSSRLILALLLALSSNGLAGCAATKSPELRVIGVHDAPRHEVVFVQVTNPAKRPMRLTKLEYTFATSKAPDVKISEGELALQREVPAGAAVIVEVPLDIDHEVPMMLSGKLTAELDQIVRTFKVSAHIAARPES